MLTASFLKQVFPFCVDPEGWTQALNPALERYEINTHARLRSFLAQTGHESSQFNRLVESLNHSTAQRLMRVWPRRFPTATSALTCVRNEADLA